MSKIKSISIVCSHCGMEFPSPIFIGDTKSFENSSIEGNIAQCPACRKMTEVNKKNMKVTLE